MGNKRYATLEDFYNDALNYNSIHNMAMGLNTSDSLIVKYLKRLEKERPKLREDLRDIWIDKRKEFLVNKEQNRTTYDFNDYAFHTFTPDSAYWLGMIASDGCVYAKKNKIAIIAQYKDKEHIDSFIDFLDYSGECKERISKCKNKEYKSVYLEIFSTVMKEQLNNLGIVSKKSNKDIDFLKFIPMKYKIYFIFGYLDGDGCISITNSKHRISILGNKKFIEHLKYFLSVTFNIESSIIKEKKYRTEKYTLNIQQYYSMYLFCKEYLKYDSPYQLKRKKEKAKELLEFLEEKIQNNENLKYNNSHFIDLRKKKKYSNGKYIKKKKKDCPYCGTKITNSADMCVDCYNKLQRRVERPSREVLKEEIRTTPFLKLSEKYGVTDNAIKKWCKSYDLPYKKSEIKLISDEDWRKL